MTNLANPATNGVRAIAGIAMLLPSVSSATVGAEPKALALGGPGIIDRVIVAWYLSQAEIVDQFKPRPRAPRQPPTA